MYVNIYVCECVCIGYVQEYCKAGFFLAMADISHTLILFLSLTATLSKYYKYSENIGVYRVQKPPKNKNER